MDLIYHRDSNPFGITFGGWTTRWWKWLHSISTELSPAADKTGDRCACHQTDPNVWFLAGTFGDPARRKCTIPSGRAIFFPIITCEFSFAEDPYLKTDEELMSAVSKDIDTVEELALSIDGMIIDRFDDFRIASEPFDDVINGIQTRMATDGYWVFLMPLAVGNHNISFMGKNFDFFNGVTYEISVSSQ